MVGKPTARTVESFTEALGVAKRFVELRSKKDKSAGEQIEVLAAEIGFGSLGYDEAKQRAAEIEGLTDAQKARIEELLVPLEVRKLLPSGRSPSPEARQAAGKAFAGMLEAGRVPKTEREYGSFFVLILDYAESAKDAGLFETALGKLRDRFGSNPRLKTFFDRQDARLKALKEAGR